jgi:CcmD family protein
MTERRILRRLVAVTVLAVCVGLTMPVAAAVGGQSGSTPAARQPQTGQSEFVPIDQLPPAEQLPAAPLLIAAYAVAWLVLLAYVWSVWRRLAAVQRELTAVAKKLDSTERRV